MYSGFLIGSDADQDRLLQRTGVSAVAVIVATVLLVVLVRPMFDKPGADRLVVTIGTPTIGVGIEANTPVLLRGAEVGRVSDIETGSGRSPEITLDLDRSAVGTLRKDFGFDYRPKNYFGISAVNILDGGNPTSGTLDTGDRVDRSTGVDNTMGMMIELGSDMVDNTMQQPMMDAIRRSLTYTSALEPLMHSGVVLATTIEKTQRYLPANLIADYNDIAGALPPFIMGVADAGHATYSSDMREAGDEVMARYATALQAIADSFFSMVGELLGGYQESLSSTVEILRHAAGVLPATASGMLTPATLADLVERLDGAFGPGPGNGRTLKVKVDFDVLPVLQTSVLSINGRGGSSDR